MAEPKKRLTSARSGKRRSHLKPVHVSLGVCAKCKNPVRTHHVCPNCGYYKGTDVLNLEGKARAKDERRKAREAEENPEEK